MALQTNVYVFFHKVSLGEAGIHTRVTANTIQAHFPLNPFIWAEAADKILAILVITM